MFKFLAKVAEKYAKTTNTACVIVGILHQPCMIHFELLSEIFIIFSCE